MRAKLPPKRVLLREIALAVSVAALVAMSPLTPDELAPSLLAGAFVGGVTFAWRLRTGPSPQAASRASEGLGRDGFVALATCVLCLLAFAPTLAWMYREWTRSVWVNDHGIFVPPFMVWLAWTVLRGDEGPAESSAWGFLPLTAGLALAVVDASARTHYLGALGLLLALPGLSLLLLGARRTRALRTPLALGLLLVPVPFTLATPVALRSMTASGVMVLLETFGYTALREGTSISLPGHNFLVADACSGIATLYASLACALMLATTEIPRSRRALIVLAAAPLALAANVVRVTLLILMTQWLGHELLDTPIHEATGVATFVIVVVALVTLARARPPALAQAS